MVAGGAGRCTSRSSSACRGETRAPPSCSADADAGLSALRRGSTLAFQAQPGRLVHNALSLNAAAEPRGAVAIIIMTPTRMLRLSLRRPSPRLRLRAES
eukprot:94516-Rhodomonas_salina.1